MADTRKILGNAISQALMAMGQGMTGQPFLTGYMQNQQKQRELEFEQWRQEQNAANEAVTNQARLASLGLVPMSDQAINEANVAQSMGMPTQESYNIGGKQYGINPILRKQNSLWGNLVNEANDPKNQAIVDAIGTYKTDPAIFRGSGGSAYLASILPKVLEKYPSFDMKDYGVKFNYLKNFTAGKTGEQIKSLNTLSGHLNQLEDVVNMLPNRTKFKSMNALQNFVDSQTGGTGIVNVRELMTAVRDELASVYKASGATDVTIQNWEKTLPDTLSKEQVAAFAKESSRMMGTRWGSIGTQYEASMGSPMPEDYYAPETKAFFNRYTQKFNVGGKNYNIPFHKINEFKKDMGIR